MSKTFLAGGFSVGEMERDEWAEKYEGGKRERNGEGTGEGRK
jgi:hypothetical protein